MPKSDAQYDRIIKTALGRAAATGPLIIVPVPAADVMTLSRVWGTMMVAVAGKNGLTISKERADRVSLAMLMAMGAYDGKIKLVLRAVSSIPGAGIVLGAGSNAVANGARTLWFAYDLIDLFEHRRDIGNLEDQATRLIAGLEPLAKARRMRRIAAFIGRQRR